MSSLLERTRDVSETEKALYTIVMPLLWANSSGRKLETPNVRRERTRHLTPIVRNPSKTFMTGILTAKLRKSWWRGDKHLCERDKMQLHKFIVWHARCLIIDRRRLSGRQLGSFFTPSVHTSRKWRSSIDYESKERKKEVHCNCRRSEFATHCSLSNGFAGLG